MTPTSPHAIALATPPEPTDHSLGSEHAPVTLVEYGDFECPSCKVAVQTPKLLLERFPNKVRFIFRHFPLPDAHPHALLAAEASEAAAGQGRFWQMHDLLYENQGRLDDDLLVELAQALHLAPAPLLQALETKEFQPHVRADFTGGVRSGVNGTPTFFINGQRHDGSYDFASLVEAIDLVLE